jgi:4-methylaminobutanoate oxidase (formaldehyde-forming)
MDMSFMSKFLVQGRAAGPFLDHLSANSVNTETGLITYTQWLNEGGTLEADLTVTKLDEDRFWGGGLGHRPPPRRDLDAPSPRR